MHLYDRIGLLILVTASSPGVIIYNVDIGTGSLSQVGSTLTLVGVIGVSSAISASSDINFNKLAFVVLGGKPYHLEPNVGLYT